MLAGICYPEPGAVNSLDQTDIPLYQYPSQGLHLPCSTALQSRKFRIVASLMRQTVPVDFFEWFKQVWILWSFIDLIVRMCLKCQLSNISLISWHWRECAAPPPPFSRLGGVILQAGQTIQLWASLVLFLHEKGQLVSRQQLDGAPNFFFLLK